MIQIENHCCDCATGGYPCIGSACPRRRVEVHYCDHCGEELDAIYEVDDLELCENCFEKIEEEN